MTKTDREALATAYDLVIKGPDKARAKQVAAMAATDGWKSAAEFAARLLQIAALGLRPWEMAPCQADPGGRDPASRLLNKMLAAGFSRWHTDPTEVLAGSRPEAGDRDTRNTLGSP
jgi:hypothetical protein